MNASDYEYDFAHVTMVYGAICCPFGGLHADFQEADDPIKCIISEVRYFLHSWGIHVLIKSVKCSNGLRSMRATSVLYQVGVKGQFSGMLGFES
ncbi:hypothetical protein FKM82_015289 [Ascaphus truei]